MTSPTTKNTPKKSSISATGTQILAIDHISIPVDYPSKKTPIRPSANVPPVHVYPDPSRQGYFILADGKRRITGYGEVQRHSIEAVVHANESAAKYAKLVNELGHEALDPMQIAVMLNSYFETLPSESRASVKATLCEETGKSLNWVEAKLRLLKLLPELQDAVAKGIMSESQMATITEFAPQVQNLAVKFAGDDKAAKAWDVVRKNMIEAQTQYEQDALLDFSQIAKKIQDDVDNTTPAERSQKALDALTVFAKAHGIDLPGDWEDFIPAVSARSEAGFGTSAVLLATVELLASMGRKTEAQAVFAVLWDGVSRNELKSPMTTLSNGKPTVGRVSRAEAKRLKDAEKAAKKAEAKTTKAAKPKADETKASIMVRVLPKAYQPSDDAKKWAAEVFQFVADKRKFRDSYLGFAASVNVQDLKMAAIVAKEMGGNVTINYRAA